MTKLFDDSARIVCKLPVHVCVLCVCVCMCVSCVCVCGCWYMYIVYIWAISFEVALKFCGLTFSTRNRRVFILYFILSIHNSAGEMTTLYKGNYTEITGSFSTKIFNSIAELHGLKLYHLHTFINLINLHIGITEIYFKLCTKMPALYERNIS